MAIKHVSRQNSGKLLERALILSLVKSHTPYIGRYFQLRYEVRG